MFVIIIGGGRVGSHLATLLIELGHKVRLIENRPKVIERLHREIPTEVIHVGDPLDPQVLDHAGIREAKVMVAAMSDDGSNLAVTQLAKFEFNTPRVIGRVNNPRYAWLFRPEMGVDVKLNAADVLARLLQEEMELNDLTPVMKLGEGNFSLVTKKISSDTPIVNTPIQDLTLPETCLIAAIIRNGELLAPHTTTTFEIGDDVFVIVDDVAAKSLAELFGPATIPGSKPPPSEKEGVL
jgi:trk system potassium uptake protein TrkA